VNGYDPSSCRSPVNREAFDTACRGRKETAFTMESMPFLHANRVFTITFADDLAFAEVRAILDYLLEAEAMNPLTQDVHREHHIAVAEASFQVWVDESEVFIVRNG
jgi:hypothetical protein